MEQPRILVDVFTIIKNEEMEIVIAKHKRR